MTPSPTIRTIHLAGGCFWGIQKLLSLLHGVVETQAGYANGPGGNPTYEEVCADSGHVEAVRVTYDTAKVDLATVLDVFFAAIDPTSLNRQGTDEGVQYRSGVYWSKEEDQVPIALVLATLRRQYTTPLAIEVAPLDSFHPAEEYHQEYLAKNPGGTCHVDPAAFARAAATFRQERFLRDDDELRERLSPVQYEVAVHGATEADHSGEYDSHFEPGIYVDVASGDPLFVSSHKFEAGCGWPSFARPIRPDAVVEVEDTSRARVRTEIRSAISDIHLGHVFDDGPEDLGGRRYCINSASLRFVPRDRMAREGYDDLAALVDSEAAGGNL